MTEPLLSMGEAAKVLGKGRSTIWNWVNEGRLKAVTFQAGSFKCHGIPRAEVERLLKEMQPPGWEALQA